MNRSKCVTTGRGRSHILFLELQQGQWMFSVLLCFPGRERYYSAILNVFLRIILKGIRWRRFFFKYFIFWFIYLFRSRRSSMYVSECWCVGWRACFYNACEICFSPSSWNKPWEFFPLQKSEVLCRFEIIASKNTFLSWVKGFFNHRWIQKKNVTEIANGNDFISTFITCCW